MKKSHHLTTTSLSTTPVQGALYIVATPIGNLADMTDRARHILIQVELIACEDTRHSRPLLTALGINTPLLAYHDHNENEMAAQLVARLTAGAHIALISDAGTPLINDPGFILVRAARDQQIPVIPIPGACAVVCALSAAGLPSDRFLFVGFPPRTTAQRLTWAQSLANETGTIICYESGQRIIATVTDVTPVFGAARPAVIARELTKQFETFITGTLAELVIQLTADPNQQRGEFVLLIAGAPAQNSELVQQEQRRVLQLLMEAVPLKQAAALAAQITGGNRNELYRAALSLKQADE